MRTGSTSPTGPPVRPSLGKARYAQQFADAVEAGRAAVGLREQVGDPAALAPSLLRLAGSCTWLVTPTAHWPRSSGPRRSRRYRGRAGRAAVATHRGMMLVRANRPADAVVVLRDALTLADREDLLALGHNFLGMALCDLGDPRGRDELAEALRIATAADDHPAIAHAHVHPGRDPEPGRRLGRARQPLGGRDRVRRRPRDVERQLQPRGPPGVAASPARRPRRRRAAAAPAGRRGRRSRDAVRVQRPGARPVAGPSRRPAAGPMLTEAWARAVRQGTCSVWPTPGSDTSSGPGDRTAGAGLAGYRAAATVHRPVPSRRSAASWSGTCSGPGWTVPGSEGCLSRTRPGCAVTGRAADGWQRVSDSYEQALELTGSDDAEPEAALAGLRILDELGARPAATMARDRLKRRGVRIPRGARRSTPGQPGRSHRPPGRRAQTARERPDERRDRGPAGALGAYCRPSCVGHPGQARRQVPS